MKLAACIVLLTTGCFVQVVDLSTPQPQLAAGSGCREGERVNPATGRCAPCTELTPPEDTCSCSWEYAPRDFPYCDAPEAYYECSACEGDWSSCNGFAPADMIARDCVLLLGCCAQLQDSGTPCCPTGERVACEPNATGTNDVWCEPEGPPENPT